MPFGEERKAGMPVSTLTAMAVQQAEEQLLLAISTCESDLRRGEEDLARLHRALQSLRSQRRTVARSRRKTQELVKPPNRIKRRREGSAASLIINFAREALRTAGRPLNRGELLTLLEEAGITIRAKYPVKRIGKVMWDSGEFQNAGDGYWFANESLPTSNFKDSTYQESAKDSRPAND